MSDVKTILRMPTAVEYDRIRAAAGWGNTTHEAAAAALRNTLFGVCVEKDGRTIGIGRVVGDGALTFFVQDIIVLPEHQRCGYGTMIMDAVMGYIGGAAQDGAFIGLFAASGMEPWYERYGFVRRPEGFRGHGMSVFQP